MKIITGMDILDWEINLLKEIDPKKNLNEEVYKLFPILSEKNFIQRLNPNGENERYTMCYEILIAMATSIIDSELDLARAVIRVIFVNPLFQFGRGDRISKILNEIMAGKKISCIWITERKHGSNAVNMETKVTNKGDHVIFIGEKLFMIIKTWKFSMKNSYKLTLFILKGL